jgi:hypothetical protein
MLSGIPVSTLRRWCQQRRIPAIKRGGVKLWLLDLQELKKKGGIGESTLISQLVAPPDVCA